jgi:hypothetical protein
VHVALVEGLVHPLREGLEERLTDRALSCVAQAADGRRGTQD